MRPLSFLIFFIYVFFNSSALLGQSIKGKILNEDSSTPMSNVEISINDELFYSDPSGKFEIPNNFKSNILNLIIKADGFDSYNLELANSNNETIELGIIFISPDSEKKAALSGSYLVDFQDLDVYDFDDGVSSLLSAAWDPFSSLAGYNFGATRYNARGMSQDHSSIFLNGVPFNNQGDGRYFWSLWGGLNDAFRSKYSQHGLNTTDFTVGGFAGTEDINLRATNQRAGTKLTMDHTNRSYQYRTMLTHNSGVQENGWAYAFTVSKRWGNGGYAEGTYYDGYAYFASIDKEISDQHSLNLLAFASPTVRGRGGASTQEMYDLLDDNYYNPNWGYQNGKVRNSREYRTHQPVFMLRHDFTPNDRTELTTSVAFQTGKFGSTRLGWLEAGDPRPDYYGNLPYDNSETLSESDLAALIERYEDPSVHQLNWDDLYTVNRERNYEIRHISGLSENNTTENISAYVLEEQRFDNNKMVFNTNLNHQLGTNTVLQSGITFQYDRNHNFKEIADLLGGSYYLDIDGFALRGSNDAKFIQNDLARPNRLLSEGDRYGYDYYKHIQNINAWSTIDISLKKVDFKVSGKIENTRFWREGLVENGKFPGTGPGLHSLGNSDVASFMHGMLKLGAVYKINGRNYAYANGAYMTRAPFSRNGFESPDTRNSLVKGLITEKVMGGEIGYILRHPRLNARLTAFCTQSKDAIKSASFYLVNLENSISAFGNLITSNIQKVNYGLELGLNYKLSQTMQLRYAAALGEYYFDSNQDAVITIDNSGIPINYDRLSKSYMKGFNLAGVPQIAHSLELRYESPKYWNASLTASYFDDMYIDANPVRRTTEVSQAILNTTEVRAYDGPTKEEIRRDIVTQEKFPSMFKLDFYARKSFKWNEYRLAVYLSVENLLNTTTNIIGGYEQLRFDYVGLDPNRWGARYYYAYGTIYRTGLNFSF